VNVFIAHLQQLRRTYHATSLCSQAKSPTIGCSCPLTLRSCMTQKLPVQGSRRCPGARHFSPGQTSSAILWGSFGIESASVGSHPWQTAACFLPPLVGTRDPSQVRSTMPTIHLRRL
jgi:hypothetical protein